MYLGDFAVSSVIDFKWNTVSNVNGSVTRTTNGTLRIYKGNSVTERTSLNGVTDTKDFDTQTGVHHCRVDTSDNTDAGFYATGNEYQVVINGMVIDGLTVNAVIAEFSIEKRSNLRPTVAGRTLDVNATGEAGIDWANIAAPTTTVALSGTTVGTVTTLTNDPTGVTTLLTRIPAALFSGITSLAQWLGSMAGKQTPNATAQTEMRAAGAGSGTYDATTDSNEAVRDRGDAAWLTGAGGDPWATAIPGAYGAGTAGNILGSRVDAAITTRATPAQVQTELGVYGALKPTVATRTLDVTTTGEAGLDWGNIGAPTSTVALTGTTVGTVTTLTNDPAGVTTLLARVTSTLFTGITSLKEWLGLLGGKQAGNATARTELRSSGAGSGTFDETTDSQEALRDRGDAAWITGSAGDPWATAVPGAYSAGSAGNILGNRLDVAVSTRATPAQVQTELGTYAGLKPTVSGRTLDVTATGEAALDYANTAGTPPDPAGVGTLLTRVPSALTITSGKVDVNDKTGFSLSTAGIDAVWAKTMTELSAVPGVTASMQSGLQWIFLLARNKITQTATTQVLRNDADSANIATSTVSDDGTTFIRGEFG